MYNHKQNEMLTLNCKITIGVYEFTYVTELTISESSDMFSRTAHIVLPQRFYNNSINNIFEIFKIGDPVEIQIGYYPNIQTRFKGYVSKRVPNSPVEIHCEDESFKYKQEILKPITQTDTTLGKFISAIYTGKTDIYEPTRKIGTWRIGNYTTFLKVLDNLRQTFGLSAFWDYNGTLYIDEQLKTFSAVKGLFYYDTAQANMIDISSLNFQEAAEFKQVVKGTSQQEAVDAQGKPIDPIEIISFYNTLGKIQTVDADLFNGYGNVNNFKIPYLTKAALTTLCETKLKTINFTGYRGDFKTFGEPVIRVNDDLEIHNDKQKEMQGRYRVKSVNTSFGINEGYRQTIQVAQKTGDVIKT